MMKQYGKASIVNSHTDTSASMNIMRSNSSMMRSRLAVT